MFLAPGWEVHLTDQVSSLRSTTGKLPDPGMNVDKIQMRLLNFSACQERGHNILAPDGDGHARKASFRTLLLRVFLL